MNHVAQFAAQLENGEHLDQATFHDRYVAAPSGFQAELVGGMVFVASPVSSQHSALHALVMLWLGDYWAATPGVQPRDNPTIVLGDQSEPQPDAVLMVEPDRGGACRVDEAGFLHGPPELVVEIAHSSRSFDLHEKRRDYERAGIREYLVAALREAAVHWFLLEEGVYRQPAIPAGGVWPSAAFPGLWLDTAALFRLDPRGVKEALAQGLATPEHAAFRQRLLQTRIE